MTELLKWDSNSFKKFFIYVFIDVIQRLERDRTACSTEEDRRVLRFTRESFESRWENVSKTAQTRKRQSEERAVLCKEFWNEFRKFVEWLDETEKALGTAVSGRAGFGSPRSKLKVYEVSACLTVD